MVISSIISVTGMVVFHVANDTVFSMVTIMVRVLYWHSYVSKYNIYEGLLSAQSMVVLTYY